jgi:hypothetical protein
MTSIKIHPNRKIVYFELTRWVVLIILYSIVVAVYTYLLNCGRAGKAICINAKDTTAEIKM